VTLGAIILAGGASSRMGADKGAMLWAGVRAVDRVAALARSVGALQIITVGACDYGLPFVADEPPLGGPVGAVAAGVAALLEAGHARALVLAVDAPTARPEDLAPLLAVQGGPGAAFEGLHLPMLIGAAAIPLDAQPDWPLARLVERAGLRRLICPPEARDRLRGANTPNERKRLLAALAAAESRARPA